MTKPKNQITLDLLSKTAIELARFMSPEENPLRSSPLEDALNPDILKPWLKKALRTKTIGAKRIFFLTPLPGRLDRIS